MRGPRTLLGLVGAAALVAAAPGGAHADRRNPLDPFQPGVAPARLAAASQPASRPASQPAPGPPVVRGELGPLRMNAPRACRTDVECPQGTICEQESCVPLQFRINAAYLYYRSAGKSFLEIGGLYWRQRGKSGYRVVAPVYWHFWTSARKFRAVAPLYWHAEDHAQGLATTVVPPVQWGSAPDEQYVRFWPLAFYSDYGEKGSSFTLLPLVHARRRGSYSSFFTPIGGYGRDAVTGETRGLALLYYWHRARGFRADAVWPLFYASSGADRATAIVAPLNCYWRRQDRTRLVSVPFAFYAGDRKGSLTVVPAPPIISYRNEDYRFTTVFPLFWRFGTERRGQTWLLPLAFAGHREDRSHLVVFPLLWRFADAGGRTTVVANGWYHRDRTGSSAGFAPLAFFGSDRQRGVSHATVLPLFHYSTEAYGRHTFLLTPLGIHETDRDAGTSYTWLLNYYRRRDPQREVDTVVPLYLRWKDVYAGSTVQAITPLFWLRSDAAGSSQVLFPAVWRFIDAEQKIAATVVVPLFYRRTAPDAATTVFVPGYYARGPRGWDAGLAPIFFAGGGERRYGVLFPWLWHFADARSSTTVAAPFYHHRDEKGWSAGLAPLLFVGNRAGTRHFVLAPLFWRFANEAAGSATTVVGPAYYGRSRTGYRAGLAPLLFFGREGASEHQIVAPLFFRLADSSRGDETLVAGPFYRRTVGTRLRQTGFFPFVDSTRTFTPNDTAELTILPVLYHRRQPGSSLWVTPLGGRLQQPPIGRDTLVVGPYVHHRTRYVDGHAVVPFYASWRNAAVGSKTTVALPLGVYHRTPTQTQGVIFPIVWYFRDEKESDLTVFPVYGRVRSPDLDADIGFPLYWSFRSPTRRTWVVGPGWYSEGLKPESVNTGVFPLYLYRRDPARRSITALPLFHYGRSLKERRSLFVLGPFFHQRRPDGYTTALLPVGFLHDRGPRRVGFVLPFFWHQSDAESDVHTNVLGPFLYRRNGGARTYGLMPVIFARTFTHGGSFTLVPALNVLTAPDRTRVLTPVAGLSYGKGVGPTWGYFGPLWWLRKQNWSADGLAPIAWRFHDLDARRQTTMIFPLWYSQSQPDSSFRVAFPFVWHARSIAVETTVVMPFWFDVNRYYQERTTVVFPLGYRHYDAEDDTARWVSLPSIYVRSRPEGTDAFAFPLLWHWGGRERSTTVVLPLYWDFKRGPERSSTFFPLVWRFSRPEATTWVVLNTVVRSGKGRDEGTWRVIFVPLFEVSRPRPADLSWDFLGGLVGYSRIGRNRVLRLGWQDRWLDPLPPRAAPPRPAPPKPALPPARRAGAR